MWKKRCDGLTCPPGHRKKTLNNGWCMCQDVVGGVDRLVKSPTSGGAVAMQQPGGGLSGIRRMSDNRGYWNFMGGCRGCSGCNTGDNGCPPGQPLRLVVGSYDDGTTTKHCVCADDQTWNDWQTNRKPFIPANSIQSKIGQKNAMQTYGKAVVGVRGLADDMFGGIGGIVNLAILGFAAYGVYKLFFDKR